MPSLQELVHALPPELFDYVKDLVLAPEKTETLTITQRHYKPSKLLQLSTATRTQYAEKLYSPSTVLQFEDLATLCKWLGSLTKSHRRLIHHIRMIVDVAGIRVESIDEMVLDHFYYHQSLSTPQLCPVRTWEMDVLTDITRFLEGKLGKFKAGVIQFAYNRPINTLTELPAYAGLEEWATMLRIERATDKYLMERTASAWYVNRSRMSHVPRLTMNR